jgi:hypothetical protein
MQEFQLDHVEWREIPNPDVSYRPQSRDEWIGFLIAFVCFGLLFISGIFIGRLSWPQNWLFFCFGLFPLFFGGYGLFRLFSSLFVPPVSLVVLENLHLEVSYKTNQFGTGIYGVLHFKSIKNPPKKVFASIELRPEFHENRGKFSGEDELVEHKNRYLFSWFINRHETLHEQLYYRLQLQFHQKSSAFYDVNLDPIPKSVPLKIISFKSREEQFLGFENNSMYDLFISAYNGKTFSAGYAMHNGEQFIDCFSDQEKKNILTVSFDEVTSYLEEKDWFKPKSFKEIPEDFQGYCILQQKEEYRIRYIELIGYSDWINGFKDEWFSDLHITTNQREAHEAFLLHSSSDVLYLKGATERKSERSQNDGKIHPQHH